jgi:hypothetical protein
LRALIFLLGALIVAAVAHVLWLSEDHPSIRFTLFQKDAGDLLAALVANAELPITQANAVYRLEEDGTQPDTACRHLSSPPPQIRCAPAFFTRADVRA